MERYRGRGALSNPPPRYLGGRTEGVDDGWYQEELPDSIATEVRPEPARSIISRNGSPDIPFEQSINPYRGCEHGCVYCMAGDTPVLMADGSQRALAQVRTGDAIYGTERQGWYRRYVRTRVLAHWSVIKPAYRVTLEDGTELVAGGDHRFLTDRGWRFVAAAPVGAPMRPMLTTGSRLLGTGRVVSGPMHDESYRRGYLCGLVQGERLSDVRDERALTRADLFWGQMQVGAQRMAVGDAWRSSRRPHSVRMREALAWPRNVCSAPRGWQVGLLAGLIDASGASGVIHGAAGTLERGAAVLRALGFRPGIERLTRPGGESVDVLRVLGGLREQLRLVHETEPSTWRGPQMSGLVVPRDPRLGVVCIEPVGRAMRLYDITTGTEDFIANGVVSHNCYARPSHAYMDLSPGIDFETRLFYKADAALRLEEELARPGYVPKHISLGANTDPYQPLERQLRVTRSVLEVLERTRHPLSIVTKGTLILRDLDLLTSLARDQLVNVFVSVTSLDADLKRTLEPRAAAPAARLRVVRELSAAGVPTGVLVAPIIPAVNDSEVERIVGAVAAAGARSVGYVLLRLPHELRTLFRQWLDEHLPERAEHVMALVRETRGGQEYDPSFGTRMVGTGAWAQLLRDRFALACKRHGIAQRRLPEPSAAHFRPPGRGGQMALPL